MGTKLEELNAALGADLEAPLRIGIGIHVGPAIVGEMGYGQATSVTAIGDSVNTASRLEAQSKTFGAQLVVSERVAERAGVDLSAFESHEIQVRGRQEPLRVWVVPNARALPAEGVVNASAIGTGAKAPRDSPSGSARVFWRMSCHILLLTLWPLWKNSYIGSVMIPEPKHADLFKDGWKIPAGAGPGAGSLELALASRSGPGSRGCAGSVVIGRG